MARCNSLNSVKNKILVDENKAIKTEPSPDSDADSDIEYMLHLDLSGNEEENNSGSSKNVDSDKEEEVTNHPVLSLKCLHEDNDEGSSSKSNDDDLTSKFIDVNDVPELSFKFPDKDETQVLNNEPESENEIEEHPNLESVTRKALVPDPASTVLYIPVKFPTQIPLIPVRSNWDGLHNFKIKVDCGSGPKRSDSAVFSESRNKLYVCKDVPFKVLVGAKNVPPESLLNVHAVFSRPEHSCDVLQRCPTHAQQDFIKGDPAYEHFVQCVSDAAVYNKNGKIFSVSVPYEKPQNGETFSTYLFKLTCFNSCVGGINRRPFTLVFTLEKNKIPLGRQILEAKVCACPLRDCRSDNQREEKKKSEKDEHDIEQSTASVQCRAPIRTYSSVNPTYSISVKDRELFEFLQHMKVLYEMGIRQVLPDT